MTKSVEQLIEVLKQEINVYKEMLQISMEKTDVIIRGQIKRLEEMTDREQKLIMKIGKLEDIRENIVFNLQKELDIEGEPDMSKLNDYIQDDHKKLLEEQKEQLLGTLNELKERNALNGTLIQDSLEYINLNIDLLTNNSFDNTYSDSSKGDISKPARRMFDTKA